MAEMINAAVRSAVKTALDGDSDILRGTECEAKSREDMRKLVTELKTSLSASVFDMRQDLIDRLNETSNDLRTMVKEEVSSVRIQVTALENSLGEFHGMLHQGDTNFAVINSKMATMQSEIDRVRDTPLSGMRAVPSRESTNSHRKKSGEDSGEKALVKSPTGNVLVTALVTALGTTLAMWGVDLLTRGARDVVQEVSRPHANAPTTPTPAAAPVPPQAAPAP